MKILQLLEKISLSKAKEYTAAWKKYQPHFYDELFSKYKENSDKKGYRLYFDAPDVNPAELMNHSEWIDILKDDDSVASKVRQFIINYDPNNWLNYNFDHAAYIKGVVEVELDNGRLREYKIGKLLQKKDPELKKLFDADPIRQGTKKQKMMVVISRHPVDVAGMSTDRGWKSCKNLVGGDFAYTVMADVMYGGIVAYFTDEADTNIQRPSGRVLIRPFINVDDPTDFILQAEKRTYGTVTKGFEEVVNQWISEVNDGKDAGVYCISDDVYTDSFSSHKDTVTKIPEDLSTLPYEKLRRLALVVKDKVSFHRLARAIERYHNERMSEFSLAVALGVPSRNINDADLMSDLLQYYYLLPDNMKSDDSNRKMARHTILVFMSGRGDLNRLKGIITRMDANFHYYLVEEWELSYPRLLISSEITPSIKAALIKYFSDTQNLMPVSHMISSLWEYAGFYDEALTKALLFNKSYSKSLIAREIISAVSSLEINGLPKEKTEALYPQMIKAMIDGSTVYKTYEDFQSRNAITRLANPQLALQWARKLTK